MTTTAALDDILTGLARLQRCLARLDREASPSYRLRRALRRISDAREDLWRAGEVELSRELDAVEGAVSRRVDEVEGDRG